MKSLIVLLLPIILLTSACSKSTSSSPETVPGTMWELSTPKKENIDPVALTNFIQKVKGQGVVVRNGKMVARWGYYDHAFDIASAVKPIYAHITYMSVAEGMIESLDDPVSIHEPRLATINENLDFKDKDITWRHLLNQTSCYGAKEDPGTAFDYNDFQSALLIDTLTAKVWKTSYEEADDKFLYPILGSYLSFEDKPTLYGRNAHPGRLRISPRDFARFGLLYMRKGRWGLTQVVDTEMASNATTSPLTSSIPKSAGEQTQMIDGQRSIGNPHGRYGEPHMNSYSSFWWTNGVRDDGERVLPDAPADTFFAAGHGGQHMLVMIPSLDLVVCVLEGLGGVRPDMISKKGRVLVNEHLKVLLDGIKH